MKKILRRVFLGLFAVIIIAGSVGAYYLFHDSKSPVSNRPYVIDEKGNSYLAVVGENGVTYAVVTDANGNRYAAQINADGSIGATLGNVNEQVALDDLPTNYTGEKIDETIDPDSFTGNASEVNSTSSDNSDSTGVTQPTNAAEPVSDTTVSTTDSSSKPTKPNATKPAGTTAPDKLTAYRIEKYQKIFASGTYLMEFKTNDPELGDTPITAAMKNGNFIIDTKIQNYSCKMLFVAKDKQTYILIDDFKKYCKLPEDLLEGEDLNMSDMMTNFANADVDNSQIKVKEVELGGKKLICESYKLSDGSEARFYFDGDTLVRRDNVNTDGTVDSTYILRITTDVPDSTFEIPKNYGFLNLSWLGALAK